VKLFNVCSKQLMISELSLLHQIKAKKINGKTNSYKKLTSTRYPIAGHIHCQMWCPRKSTTIFADIFHADTGPQSFWWNTWRLVI